ncbi:MAG TPA: FAD-dependent monooxygenase, partial [Labilithrix sp.]|nr:FAD-dependent monooxygenase [Labilithrix sp.]
MVSSRRVESASHRHAVVLGGSLTGLLAARVLSDHFDRVTVVERDPFLDDFEPRKGVPQGHQLHGLLNRGALVLEQLLPGLLDTVVEQGAAKCDFGQFVRWFHHGAWNAPVESGITAYAMTRPFLEGHVRSRVLALPQIEAMGNCDVVRLSSNERGRVTGVVIRRRDEPKEESVLSADLVVDATGRGSRAPAWLEELGYQRPTVETTLVRLGYASCIYHRPENQSEDWYGMVIQQTPPEGKRAGFLGRVEGNRWMCCLSGVLGDHPPTDQEGFLEFARSLPADDLYRAIRNAKPASKVMAYKYPSPERRRYEKLADFPDGFVVMGDASCSFNPLYGQGMTIAAMGAVALGEELASVAKEGDRARLGMSRRFQAKQAKIQDVPWMMGTTEDFRYPEVEGKRPFGFPAISW